MIKTLWNKFDKRQINDMPRAQFQGRIIVIQTEADTDKAVSYLLSQPILGFDTETRPKFRPGEMYPVALLQVATHDTCFLFRLCKMGFPESLVRLLSDQKVKKVALSWKDDVNQLHRRHAFQLGTFIELQNYVREFGIEDMSLQKLYANIFGQKISKNQQLTNWERDVLTDAQQEYAATDAWSCIMIYEELERLKASGKWKLIKYEDTISA